MTQHDDNCDWHVDQYPWECTCGAVPRKAIMDELIADSAEEISPEDFRKDNINFIWRTAVQFGMDWERAKIVAWLRNDDEPYPDAHDIANDIEAGEHLK